MSLMVDVSLDEWNKAFQRATKRSSMLEIETDDGRILQINPHQVQVVEQAPESELEPA
jgi:hypothetical protein